MAEEDTNKSISDETQGIHFSSPLPVYSPDENDSYETDSETDSAPSSLAYLGYASQMAATTRPSRRASMGGSTTSLDYEYETDSDASSPSQQPQQSSEADEERVHKTDIDDAGKPPLSSTGHHHQIPGFDKNASLDTVEYETDSDASLQFHPTLELTESFQRLTQDPSGDDRKSAPLSESIAIERIHEELEMANERAEKWKASSQRLDLELTQMVAEVQNQEMAHDDLRQRLIQLESEKVASENAIGNLGTKVAALHQLLAEEQAAHSKTKIGAKNLRSQMENLPNDSSPQNQNEGLAALQELVEEKDFIIRNALVSHLSSESEEVAELEDVIQEAREIIKGSAETNPRLETEQATIQEKDVEIEALKSKNQELLLSQNALKHKNESLEALLTRKDGLLKRKDEEISSLKEVIRKKDASLRSKTASLEERRESAQASEATKKPETEAEDPNTSASTAPPSRRDADSVAKASETAYHESTQVPGDKSLNMAQPETETISTPSPICDDRQKQLEYDLDEELDSLRSKVYEMMEEMVLLTEAMDRKDAALNQATRQLEKYQARYVDLRAPESSTPVSMEQLQLDEMPISRESFQARFQDARESIANQKLIIASLETELKVERLRREELEHMVNENGSSGGVSISDVDSDEEQADPSGTSGMVKEDTNNDRTGSVGQVGIRVFGQEQKLDAELEKEAALENPNDTTEENDYHNGSSATKLSVMEVAEELSDLKHSIHKRDETIDSLRIKLQEHEALISLLNKTLSGKDIKIDRLERLIGRSHYNVNISKALEENEMTIDSLVLYRLDKEREMAEMKERIHELEDQVRASKEAAYQLRRRTEELSGAEAKIRRLKAEVKSESKRMSQLLEENQEKLSHAKEEKIRLQYEVQTQCEKLNEKLRQKDDLIKSIDSEATERGLLIDSLEASLQETNQQLKRAEFQVSQQESEVTLLMGKIAQLNREKAQFIAEQNDKDELIQMLNDSRLEGQRIIAELTKPKPETSRQKALRRYQKLREVEGVSGLEAYMEPFVLDIHQAQAHYEIARKNLRLAEARERLIRPRE